jgi:hypothetical protein
MTTQNQELPTRQAEPSKEDYRELWVQAVEQLATNAQLKSRIEFLEREIATNALSSWTIH